MANFDRRFVLLAFPALGACAGMPDKAAAPSAASDAYVGKSVLDAAIAAAGGEAALRAVNEMEWSGTASITAAGKTTELEMRTILRPFSFARSTSWPKAEGEKAARTIQVEFGKAWSVNRVTWTPMNEAEEAHEIQQYALYGLMLLVPLKDPGAWVLESAPGMDGVRSLHTEHPGAPATDLRFDASGKLVGARNRVRDPKGAAAPIAQVIDFSGEIASNGVKWPQRITIRQAEQPYFDLQISRFEARGTNAVVPLVHTLEAPQQPAQAPARPGD